MPVSLASWLELEDEFSAVNKRIDAARADREHARLNALHVEQRRILSRGATALPRSGPVADRVVAQLEALEPGAPLGFAVPVLLHRKQFPRIYLPSVVRLASRFRFLGDDSLITLASHTQGTEAVLRELVACLESGLLPQRRAEFLLYYVRPRRFGGADRSDPKVCADLRKQIQSPP